MVTELPQPKPATIYDVAREAKVSHQTVALYLRGHTGFRAETRERVERALRDLNYRPNRAARALATRRSYRIAALVYEMLEIGPAKTIQGAAERAREAGYLLDVVAVDPDDASALDRAIETVDAQDVAGVVAFAPVDQLLGRLEGATFHVPVLLETEPGDEAQAESIHSRGLDPIVDHLVGLGHTRIGYLGGPPDWLAARNRETALREALARHGLEPAGVVYGNWSSASGHAAVLGAGWLEDVTALVVANDQTALGAILALTERGFRVPDDISVTGFDDTPEAAFYRPPLTTVRIDYAQQGRDLVERLLARIDPDTVGGGEPATRAPELVIRASTAPPSMPAR
ncbi:LacI family DNA-binding transcriptional regulator [Lysobacter korlensis]|uniref:LacI family DNA-binding transcriptional regulator n=1 Tax=Lysobacter korlensis TaxID=553636 RepID=A0ABV6RY77_9GAMM